MDKDSGFTLGDKEIKVFLTLIMRGFYKKRLSQFEKASLIFSGPDGIRTRDLLRDRQAF